MSKLRQFVQVTLYKRLATFLQAPAQLLLNQGIAVNVDGPSAGKSQIPLGQLLFAVSHEHFAVQAAYLQRIACDNGTTSVFWCSTWPQVSQQISRLGV